MTSIDDLIRVLQLRKYGLWLELHPFVNVVRGLDENTQDQVVNALSAIPSGRDPGISGVIEAHGVLFDLNPDNLALLDLHTPLDVVVRHEDLPGVASARAADPEAARALAEGRVEAARVELGTAEAALAAARIAAEAEPEPEPMSEPDDPEAARRELEDEQEGHRAEADRLTSEMARVTDEVERARRAHEDARRDLAAAVAAVDEARDARQAASLECSLAAGELESARAGRDPFAASALEAAREHLAELETDAVHAERAEREEAERLALEDAAEDGDPIDPVDAAERLASLEARRPRLEAALLAISAIDRESIQLALDGLRDGPPVEHVRMPEALDLADAIEQVERDLTSVLRVEQLSGDAVADARARLDTARTALALAEQAVRGPELSRTDINALESAHAEVLAAQDRADGRIGRQRAAKRLTDARAAEQRVLDDLGFNTYADFMMGTSITHIDSEAEQALDVARQTLADAEDEWSALQAHVDAELNRAQLVERRRELRDRGVVLLESDPGDDLVWALRQHRVQVDTSDRRSAQLRNALEKVGLVLGDELFTDRELVELSEIWLAEDIDTAARRELVEHELAEVDLEMARMRDLIALVPSDEDGDDIDPAVRRRARVEEARAAVQAAHARVARHADAELEVEERHRGLEVASDVERAAAQAIADAEDVAAAAATAEHEAAAEREALEIQLADVEAAAHDAVTAVAALGEQLAPDAAVAGTPAFDDVPAGRGPVEEAEAAVALAMGALAEAETAAAAAQENGSKALVPGLPAGDLVVPVDDVEWYLLARLAALRSVSYAGSVPIVLDDALAGLGEKDTRRVLDRLERMAASVQVVILSDDDVVAAWAASVGPDRAAIVAART